MKENLALEQVRKRLENRRDYYKDIADGLKPGQQRDIYYERASLISEALEIVGEVELLMKETV